MRRITLHDCNLETANIEEFFGREGVEFIPAGVNFTPDNNGNNDAGHFFEVMSDECQMRDARNHSQLSTVTF